MVCVWILAFRGFVKPKEGKVVKWDNMVVLLLALQAKRNDGYEKRYSLWLDFVAVVAVFVTDVEILVSFHTGDCFTWLNPLLHLGWY